MQQCDEQLCLLDVRLIFVIFTIFLCYSVCGGLVSSAGLSLKQPPVVVVEEGQPVRLPCDQENTPKSVMIWYQQRGRYSLISLSNRIHLKHVALP